MNSNYFKAVMPFAAAEGLKTDGSSGVIYGNYRGCNITVAPIPTHTRRSRLIPSHM